MADLSVKELEARYDELVQGIIEKLKRVLNDLKSVKENKKRERKELIQDTYVTKSRLIVEAKRKSGVNLRVTTGASTSAATKNYFKEIRPLEKELAQLFKEKIKIDENDYKTFLEDQKRLDSDIKKIETLLNYIEQNTKDKKARRALNTGAMYDEINAVYADGINSRKELEITGSHQQLKEKIEEKANHILREINALATSGP